MSGLTKRTMVGIDEILDMKLDAKKIDDLLIYHLIIAAFLVTISQDPMDVYIKANEILDNAIDEFVKINMDLMKEKK